MGFVICPLDLLSTAAVGCLELSRCSAQDFKFVAVDMSQSESQETAPKPEKKNKSPKDQKGKKGGKTPPPSKK